MISAEELDEEYETLVASLSELNKTFFCSERFMANYITLSLGNKKHSIEISRIKKRKIHGDNHVFYFTFACGDEQQQALKIVCQTSSPLVKNI